MLLSGRGANCLRTCYKSNKIPLPIAYIAIANFSKTMPSVCSLALSISGRTASAPTVETPRVLAQPECGLVAARVRSDKQLSSGPGSSCLLNKNRIKPLTVEIQDDAKGTPNENWKGDMERELARKKTTKKMIDLMKKQWQAEYEVDVEAAKTPLSWINRPRRTKVKPRYDDDD